MSFWILLSCLVLSALETASSRDGAEYRDKTAEYFLRRAARNGVEFQRGMTKIDDRREAGLKGEDENGDEDYLKRNSRSYSPFHRKVYKFFPDYGTFDKDKENKRELDLSELRRLEDEFLARTRELEKKNYHKRNEDDLLWKDLDEMDEEKREDKMNEEESFSKETESEDKREFLNEKGDYDLNGNVFADEKRDDVMLDAHYLENDKRDALKEDNSDFSMREKSDGYENRKREEMEGKLADFDERERENFEERKRENIEEAADKFEAKREEMTKKKDEHMSKKRDGVEEVAEEGKEKKRENVDKKKDILTEKSKEMEDKRNLLAEEDKRSMDKEEEKKRATEEATEELREANSKEQERELDPSDALSLQCESFVEGVELGKGEKECCAKQSTCPVINFMGTMGHTCFCDKEFYNCLRAVDTPLATEMATYYFNEIKSRCFTYDEKQQCQQGSCVTVQTIEAIDPPAF